MRPADIRRAEAAARVKEFDWQAHDLGLDRYTRDPSVIADAEKERPLPFDSIQVSVPALAPATEPAPVRPVPAVTLLTGDAMDVLPGLPAGKVSLCVTSPPYYGLRSYGIAPRYWASTDTTCVLGDEADIDEYIQHLVDVFREVKRVLHPRGSLWLNIGDCYAGGGRHNEPRKYASCDAHKPVRPRQRRFSPKDLLMVPARAALALQDDGWILRQDNIWAKGISFAPISGSVKPESTRDRTTWSHEHVYHFTLDERAFYDIDACREPYAASSVADARRAYTGRGQKAYATAGAENPSDLKRRAQQAISAGSGRNLRNVWFISKANFAGAHFATFPSGLVSPIVALASPEGGVCESCAAPVERRLEREPIPADVLARYAEGRSRAAAATGRTDGHTTRLPDFVRKVVGTSWERTCQCDSPIIASTVLDPFSGSGQAGVAAVKAGRSYIGIDLSDANNILATTEISKVQGAKPC